MILPPILANHGVEIKEALENHLGVACVKKVTVEEQITHVTFVPVQLTDKIKQFIRELSDEVVIYYQGRTYIIRQNILMFNIKYIYQIHLPNKLFLRSPSCRYLFAYKCMKSICFHPLFWWGEV
jgi:hypothetical protein